MKDVVLRHETDAGAATGQVIVTESGRGLLGRCDTGKDPKQRGLAGTTRPDDRGQLAGFNRDSDTVKCDGSVTVMPGEADGRNAHPWLDQWPYQRWQAIGCIKRVCGHGCTSVEGCFEYSAQ